MNKKEIDSLYVFFMAIDREMICKELPSMEDIRAWLLEEHSIFVTVTIPYKNFGRFSAEV